MVLGTLAWLFVTDAGAVKPDPYKVICHHTPGNQVTLEFANEQSYNGHLGTPHSVSTFDTEGACGTVTPTTPVTPTQIVTPTQGVTPTVSPTATPSATVTPTTSPTASPSSSPSASPNQVVVPAGSPNTGRAL